jgi:hypothetical protein
MNHNIINLGIPNESELHGLGIIPTEAGMKLSQLAATDILSLRPLNVQNLIQG